MAMDNPNGHRWAIVERAGMDDEHVAFTSDSWREALDWRRGNYQPNELDDLRPDLARWDEDEGFWTYDH